MLCPACFPAMGHARINHSKLVLFFKRGKTSLSDQLRLLEHTLQGLYLLLFDVLLAVLFFQAHCYY